MDAIFNPKSVVVIGVSESPTNLAKNIVGNLIEFGFKGIIYQVGIHGGTLFGRKIYRSVMEIEDSIDLAVILTPAVTIPPIMEECGKKGIKYVIIESAGFGEFMDERRALEDKILKTAKKYGIRFIGPNCIGTLDIKSGLATSFVTFKNDFRSGGISIITQSGGVGFSYLMMLANEDLGLSKFASIGNKLNINENDLLEYYMNDDKTNIICMYLEGISNGRRLMELAARSKKPILIQKSNIGSHAKGIAKSHTASLSSDDAVVSAAMQQAGIARFADRETLINYLKILPLPKMRGNSLAIVSRSGGHAILAADASEQVGFNLAPLNKSFIKGIEGHFRAHVIKLTNPLDLGDLFDYKIYADIIEKTLQQRGVDGAVFMHAYFSSTEGDASRSLFNKIAELSKKYDKPVGICVATDEGEFSRLRKDLSYPIFAAPSAVIRAMALSRDFYLRHKNVFASPEGAKQSSANNYICGIASSKTPRNDKAVQIIKACLRQGRNPLLQEGMDIFAAYGIPVVKGIWVKNAGDAVKAAVKIGYPVVMKIVSREISHKTDVGGVRLNIRNEAQLREEYRSLDSQFPARHACGKALAGGRGNDTKKRGIEGVVVQPMLKRGSELILGAKQDPNFGPVVLAGLGGIFVEIFKDTSIRVVPFPRGEAGKMFAELKGFPILKGARGGKPYDLAAAEDAILRLARLITDFPEIKEIDINPFYILHKGQGGFALDARIVLL